MQLWSTISTGPTERHEPDEIREEYMEESQSQETMQSASVVILTEPEDDLMPKATASFFPQPGLVKIDIFRSDEKERQMSAVESSE